MTSCAESRENSVPGAGNSECKGPGAHTSLADPRTVRIWGRWSVAREVVLQEMRYRTRCHRPLRPRWGHWVLLWVRQEPRDGFKEGDTWDDLCLKKIILATNESGGKMEGSNQLRVYDRIPDEKWLWLTLVESGKNFPCETQNKNGQAN